MASKNKRKGDTLLTFGIAGIVIGILFFGAPITFPALLVGIVCLGAWFFVRSQDNNDRRHQETVEALQAQIQDIQKKN